MKDFKKVIAVLTALILVAVSPVVSFADVEVSSADAVLEASFVSEAVEVSDVIASIEDVTEVEEVKEISEKEEITEKGEANLLSAGTEKAVAVLDGTTLYFYYDANHEPNGTTSWEVPVTPTEVDFSVMWPWYGKRKDITSVVINKSFNAFKPKALNNFFNDFEIVENIEGLCNINTTGVKNISQMFYDCWVLSGLDLSGFNTSGVTDMSRLFCNCKKLNGLDLSGFDTTNVTDMSNMFSCCSALTELDLSGFNTESVTDMHSMFGACWALNELDLTSFDTTSVTNMQEMLCYCTNMTELDLSSFNTSGVTNMLWMFLGCTSLKTIYASPSGFDVTNVTKSTEMFDGCSSLVGGKGTSYQDKQIDESYAHIDGGETDPGYFTLEPAKITKEPEALNPVYNGNEQDLVSEGEAEGGIMNYSLDGSNWDEAVPQAKDGKYTVYYKAIGNENHSDSKVKTLTAEIRHDIKIHEAKEPTCTESGNSLYYECITCGKLYKDADEKTVTTLEEVTVPAKGHDWSGKDGICRNDSSHKCDHNGIKSGVCPVCGKDLGSNRQGSDRNDDSDSSDSSDYYYSAGTYDAGTNGAVTGIWLYDIPSGTWSFSVTGGTRVTGGWVKAVNPYASGSQPKASWFYFDENGMMLTGWRWIKDKDGVVRCYYLNPVSGGLLGACWLDGRTPDGYMVDKNGAWTVSGKVQVR